MSAKQYITANDGKEVPVGDLAKDFTYDAKGNVLTITVSLSGKLYRKFLTYNANDELISTRTPGNESEWIRVSS